MAHVLDVSEDKKVCNRGKKLAHIGDDVTERLDYQPSSLYVNRYVRPKYACGNCQCDGCGVKQHPTPEGPIERCEADAGLLAYVIIRKSLRPLLCPPKHVIFLIDICFVIRDPVV